MGQASDSQHISADQSAIHQTHKLFKGFRFETHHHFVMWLAPHIPKAKQFLESA